MTSLSPAAPDPDDVTWAGGFLAVGERALWERMSAPDRRHAIAVARRFVARRPDATREEVAGALLHDVGKVEAGLGTFGRVAATIVGPRTARFRRYHDHEALGSQLAAAVAPIRSPSPSSPVRARPPPTCAPPTTSDHPSACAHPSASSAPGGGSTPVGRNTRWGGAGAGLDNRR